MNRNSDFFELPKYGLMAIVVCLMMSTNSFARQDSNSGPWPASGGLTVDHAVQHADFESDQSVGDFSSPLGTDRESWINNVKPNANELTQKLKQGAAELLDVDESAGDWAAKLKRNVIGVDVSKILSSLAIVLGGYFGFVWIMRRLNPRSSFGLPKEVVEVLGQSSFGPKKQLQLVRLGSKLLLLINSGEGTQTIGEITDPSEVEYLASLCGTKRSGHAAIAIGKAATRSVTMQSAKSPPQQTNADLKQILRQLQQVTQQQNVNSVFEA